MSSCSRGRTESQGLNTDFIAVVESQPLVSQDRAIIVHFMQSLVMSQGSPVKHEPVSSYDMGIYDRALSTEQVRDSRNLGGAPLVYYRRRHNLLKEIWRGSQN